MPEAKAQQPHAPDIRMTRRQIGLFGGSFNPPHVCHSLASLWALQTTPIEEVWWLPTYQHAFGKELVDFEHRLKMCRMATRELKHVRIHDIERTMGGESRTVDTVRELRAQEPDCDFWLVVGTDILGETDAWKEWDALMEMVHLVVVGRGGYIEELSEIDADAAPKFSLPAVSSTKIREALASGTYDADVLRDWMVREVFEYARAHELYLDATHQESG